jgi:hypothetical protein
MKKEKFANDKKCKNCNNSGGNFVITASTTSAVYAER